MFAGVVNTFEKNFKEIVEHRVGLKPLFTSRLLAPGIDLVEKPVTSNQQGDAMTALMTRLCNAFKKTSQSRLVPRRRELEVTSLEERLTPATWYVQLPVVPSAENLLYDRLVQFYQTDSELIVAEVSKLGNQIIARTNSAGYDRIEIQGTVDAETFLVGSSGLNLTIRESFNDVLHFVGVDSDTSPDNFSIGDRRSWLNDRMIEYSGVAREIRVNLGSGDDIAQVVCRSIPCQVFGEAGNDTLIVHSTPARALSEFGVSDSLNMVSVRLNGGSGQNSFVIGTVSSTSLYQVYNDAYSMDQLSGEILIQTNSLIDNLHIYDKADTTNNNYTLTDNLFSRNGYRIHHDRMSQIALYAGKGNDMIQANGVFAELKLNGNAGNDVIMGGRNADVLDGGEGHDILIGGLSTDILIGGQGDDVLFGGVLSFASDTSRLNSLRTTWTTFSNSYENRVSQMRSIFFSAVREDFAVDSLWGNTGVDWFWGSSTEVKDLQQVWMYLLSPLGGWISFYYQELNR